MSERGVGPRPGNYSPIPASSAGGARFAPSPSEQLRPGSVRAFSAERLLLAAFRSLYALAGATAVVAFCYLLGHSILEGILSGNDIPWALSMVQWYDRWFPSLPTWFPLEGAGTPLLYLYPPGTSLLVVLVHRASGLTEIQAFRLVGFLSVPIAGLGLYALVWAKTKSQTAALLAGLLYPLSSATWDWLTRIGLYAQSVTLLYVPWALLAFDAYLVRSLRKPTQRPGLGGRLAFAAAALLFAMLFVSHIPTALVFLMAVSVYAALLPLFQRGASRPARVFLLSVGRAWAGVAAGVLLAAIWVVPWMHNNALANREGLSYIPAEMVSYYDFAKTFGLVAPEATYRMTFATPVVILAAVGLVAGLVQWETPLLWGVISIASVLFVAMPGLWMGLVRVFAPLWSGTNDRAVLMAMLLMPATAAYGAHSVGRLIMALPAKTASVLARSASRGGLALALGRAAKATGIAVICLGLTASAVLYGPSMTPNRNGYGVQGWNGPLPVTFQGGRLSLLDPPLWELSQEGDMTNRADILAFTQVLGMDASTRLDVSPDLGGITQALSLYSDASIVNIYGFNASLLHALWAYQSTVSYMDDGSPQEVDELARWFGLRYLVLHSQLDPLERYDPARWPVVYPASDAPPSVVQVRQFLEAPPMATLQNSPVILVIGGFENAIYEQAFRTFVQGGLNYERGLPVEGTHDIDDYTLADLETFDAVFLHGYGYQDRERAWELLAQYVAGGGALYVDTGWQFFTPDWQTANPPDVLPVRRLDWTSFGAGDTFLVEDPSILAGIDPATLPPLLWEGQPWGVSAPSMGLRPWAHPVLSVLGIPMIAVGQYGEGRVVWSGMNLIGHAATYDSAVEREVLARLMAWLVPAPAPGNLVAPGVIRENPDHLRFVLPEAVPEGTSLIWREAFSPDWHAHLLSQGERVPLPLRRVGPGLMLVRLPATSPGDVLELEYRRGASALAGAIASGLALVSIGLWVAWPEGWRRIVQVIKPAPRPKPRGEVAWLRDAGEHSGAVRWGRPGSAEQDPGEMGRDLDLGGAEPRSSGVPGAGWGGVGTGRAEASPSDRGAARLSDRWQASRGSPPATRDRGSSGH